MYNRKVMYAFFSILVCFSSVLVAWGVSNFMFRQTLTVPNNASIAVYRSDDQTLITAGQDLGPADANQWLWTGTQFTLTVNIHNTGNTILNTTFTMNPVPSGWNFTYGGNGTLALGSHQTVTITATPPTNESGTSTGDFDFFINY